MVLLHERAWKRKCENTSLIHKTFCVLFWVIKRVMSVKLFYILKRNFLVWRKLQGLNPSWKSIHEFQPKYLIVQHRLLCRLWAKVLNFLKRRGRHMRASRPMSLPHSESQRTWGYQYAHGPEPQSVTAWAWWSCHWVNQLNTNTSVYTDLPRIINFR